MDNDIPEGQVSRLAIKYLAGDEDLKAYGMMLGVSKESHTSNKKLGYLKQDWSIHLWNGNIYHD